MLVALLIICLSLVAKRYFKTRYNNNKMRGFVHAQMKIATNKAHQDEVVPLMRPR